MVNSPNPRQIDKLRDSLIDWYLKNRRSLPWRSTKNPYFIWVSEVMLQQTTIQAATPYYEKFIKRFPDVTSLAKAPEPSLLEMWAGLGYYSRARNLQKAAVKINEFGFPKTAQELIELPGFGPYTSRAVSSLAFGERVGVLDGNVNRVLTRLTGYKKEWWTTSAKKQLQELSDSLAQTSQVSELNQGLMELGATVCTPKKPTCALCPWRKQCKSFATDSVQSIPLSKKSLASEIWLWKPELHLNQKKQLALVKNPQMPFLKNSLVFPGSITREAKKPKTFDLKHSITRFEIFVKLNKNAKPPAGPDVTWVPEHKISSINPSSALKKILEAYKKNQ